MAVYAIGDIQGCYTALMQLLEKINFHPHKDTLWFAGDLVNRGSQSLEVLRFVKNLGDNAITVLGNHDLHLLAQSQGLEKKFSHTLQTILDAPDKQELLDWLRHRPFIHHDKKLNYVMVHAGLPKQWDLHTAKICAKELQHILRDNTLYLQFLANMYGDTPVLWDKKLSSWDRLRFISNSFTRMRYCDKNGTLEFKNNGAVGTQPKEYIPWYNVPKRETAHLRIVFGHWSTLRGKTDNPYVYALDTGCLWGGTLTAMRLDNNEQTRIHITCPTQQKIPKQKK